MSTDTVVTARNLDKSYGDYHAVKGIDFDIPRGKCFGFLGPNGAGKTTTLRMLLGMTPMSGGELTIFDLPVPEKARDVRFRVGVVPQADNLDPDFSVSENLAVYASYFSIPRVEVKQRITRLLEFASLTERAHAKTDSLSGGMQRRLTIARALINNPELVVLDEPTTGLDPQARHEIWSRLSDLREQGTTLILTTHYMEEAERLCDELVIMDQGNILAQGSPRNLIKQHVEPEVIEVRGKVSKATELLQGANVRLEQMGTSLYCYTHDARAVIDKLQTDHGLTFLHRPSGLEDVFLKLTGRELRD